MMARDMLVLVWLSAASGCASFAPPSLGELPFRERLQTRSQPGITVSCAVPTRSEAEALYGVDLASRGIQAVWLEVENTGAHPWWFLAAGLDAQGFSAAEAAYAFHRDASAAAEPMEAHFRALEFVNPAEPGETVSGFVLVHLDEGYKAVDLDFVCQAASASFTFAFSDPEFRSDVSRLDLDALWAADEIIELDDEEALRAALVELPVSTANRRGDAEGDPLNLVVVGERAEIFAAMVRRGWSATEIIGRGSLWRTLKSFLTGSRYRYSPISPLYVFGRPQDFSGQKARGSINERNHMRFWLTPLRFRGRDVWVGQISRDIGVKFTLKSPTISTHVIDPDVDEARRYLLEDLMYSQALQTIGFLRAQEPVLRAAPRENLVGDPYYTDGHRLVMIFERRPLGLDELELLDWDWPSDPPQAEVPP